MFMNGVEWIMRRALLTLCSGLFLAVSPSLAEACSCVGDRPPCQETWTSPIVFAGRVTAIVPVKDGDTRFGPRRVRFAVTEAFRGPDTPEVDIHLDGSSCDPDFKEGEEYLVYGSHRRGAGWTASSCSRTRPLRDAAEDLAYLRLPDEKKGTSRIIGQVLHQKVDVSTSRSEFVPIPGVAVTVIDGDWKVETRTDQEGQYSVPVGSHRQYTVTFGGVEGLRLSAYPETVWIPHHRSCASVVASAHYDGRLSGQVVDSRGAPVPFFPLTLAPSPATSMGGFERHAVTDVGGRFQFERLNPAPYVIAPSTTLWRGPFALSPLTASPVALGPSARVDAGVLRLPDAMKVTLLEIQLEDGEGKPAKGVYVYVKRPGSYDALFPDAGTATDDAGMFRVSLIAGRRYEIEARHTRYVSGRSIDEMVSAVIEATGLKPIRLRLAPPR